MPTSEIQSLCSIRDWLRFAVTRFTSAGLVYGHGTTNAVDEGAFIILSALNLPIDVIEPWLDCRLTEQERLHVADLIARRIETRKPAAYLLNQAWIQGHKFYVDERVIVPRSYIGELLCTTGLAGAVADAHGIRAVLDVCTGSGCLAILAALAFPGAHVTASDISSDALAVASRNVGDYGLNDRVKLMRSNAFDDLAPHRFDLVLANPPYVRSSSVNEFPQEYAAEPKLAHDGGADGLDLVRRILSAAPSYLADNGVIVVEIGEGRRAVETAFPDLPFLWLDTENSEAEVFALSAHDFRDGTRRSVQFPAKRQPNAPK